MDNMRDFIQAQIDSVLHQAINEHGFELPIYVTAVSSNGYLVFGRYENESLEFQLLAKHEGDLSLKLPYNIMITDSKLLKR